MKLAKEQILVGVSENFEKPYNVRRPMFENLSKIKYQGKQAPEYSFEEIKREFTGANKKVFNPYEVDLQFDEMLVENKETEITEASSRSNVASALSNVLNRNKLNS
jgi:hypothetical protein